MIFETSKVYTTMINMSEHYNFFRVFAAACTGMLLFGIVMTSLGSVLPALTTKFELDQIGAGSLASLLPLGILGGSLVFGPIVDRYSYRNLLIVCTLFIMVGLEGIAISNNIRLLQLSFFLIGFGGGAINGGGNALVADISATHDKGKSANLSLLGVFFGIGALGMPFVMGLLSKRFTFEQIIAGIGVALVVPILYFLITKFPKPKQSQGYPLKKSLLLFKDVNLVLLGFMLFFQSGIEGLINNWTTSYLEKETGLLQSEALYVLTIFVLSLTLTRLLLASLLNRIRPYIILIVSIAIVLTGNVLLLTLGGPFITKFSYVLLGVGVAAGFPVILGYVGDIYAELSGTAFSFVLVIALIGNTILNYLMGVISQAYGIDKLIVMLLVSAVFIAIILGVALKRIAKKTKI